MRNAVVALFVMLGTPAVAQTPSAAPRAVAADDLSRRAADVLAVLQGGGDFDALFAPAFRAQIPKAQFDAISKQIEASSGKPVRIASITPARPGAGTIAVAYERATVTMEIAIDPAPPHQVIGLRVTGVTTAEASLPAIDAALAALPGRTGFLVARLDERGPTPLTARDADAPLAIGSEFKLVILATLVRDVAAGTRRWDDAVTLDGIQRPAGAWSTAAKGTRATLRDLAAKMIAVSDNSATDILLDTLGRRQVEAMMPVVGIANPALSRPFLSTAEAFKLKAVPALAERYVAADEAGRRALLAGDVARTPLAAAIGLFADGRPVRIDALEWFFSPMDVARTFDWIRRHSESGPAAEVRAILALNPALPAATKVAWTYVGYKGGSEPGVIATSWLFQARDGRWYVVSGSWNDPARAVDDTRFISLMQRAMDLTARSPR